MGQAKQRGTFEERRELALVRNKRIEQQINELPELAKKSYNKRSVQRTATLLVMAGIMSTNGHSK